MGTAYTLGTITMDSINYVLKSCAISGGRRTTSILIPRLDEGKIDDNKAKPKMFQFVIGVRGTSVATYEANLKALMAALNTGLEIKWYGNDTTKYYNVLIGDISDPFPQQVRFSSDVTFSAIAADPFRYYDTAPFVATSTTSLLIEVAAKTFTTQAALNCYPGAWVRAVSAASSANYMQGYCTSYSGTTLVLGVTAVGGSGTLADWNISYGSPCLVTPNANSYAINLYVNGDAYVRPVITVTGAFTGTCVLTNTTTGESWTYATNIAGGASFVVDCRSPIFTGGYQTGRTVKLNGTETYTNFSGDTTSGGFIQLVAGLNALTFDSTGQGGTVSIAWTDRDWGGH